MPLLHRVLFYQERWERATVWPLRKCDDICYKVITVLGLWNHCGQEDIFVCIHNLNRPSIFGKMSGQTAHWHVECKHIIYIWAFTCNVFFILLIVIVLICKYVCVCVQGKAHQHIIGSQCCHMFGNRGLSYYSLTYVNWHHSIIMHVMLKFSAKTTTLCSCPEMASAIPHCVRRFQSQTICFSLPSKYTDT